MLKIGHRGVRGYELENTISSFKKAIELKCDMIELDVRLSKDKKLLVMHDDILDRTTNGKGRLAEKTLAELKKLKTNNNEELLTLEDALKFINKKTKVNIEIKGEKSYKELNKIIKKYLKKGWKYNDFLISSFNTHELESLRKIDKKIKIAVLSKKFNKRILSFAKKINAYSINLEVKAIKEKIVKKIHKNKIRIFAWIVNNKKEIQNLKKIKVDGIISDFPDKI